MPVSDTVMQTDGSETSIISETQKTLGLLRLGLVRAMCDRKEEYIRNRFGSAHTKGVGGICLVTL